MKVSKHTAIARIAVDPNYRIYDNGRVLKLGMGGFREVGFRYKAGGAKFISYLGHILPVNRIVTAAKTLAA
jgi:hypothetical protein